MEEKLSRAKKYNLFRITQRSENAFEIPISAERKKSSRQKEKFPTEEEKLFVNFKNKFSFSLALNSRLLSSFFSFRLCYFRALKRGSEKIWGFSAIWRQKEEIFFFAMFLFFRSHVEDFFGETPKRSRDLPTYDLNLELIMNARSHDIHPLIKTISRAPPFLLVRHQKLHLPHEKDMQSKQIFHAACTRRYIREHRTRHKGLI